MTGVLASNPLKLTTRCRLAVMDLRVQRYALFPNDVGRYPTRATTRGIVQSMMNTRTALLFVNPVDRFYINS